MGWHVAGPPVVVRAALAMVLATALGTAAGCGGGGAQTTTKAVTAHRDAGLTPVSAGKFAYARGLFNELCAGCHTLADAGAHGHRFDLDHVPDLEGAEVWNAIQNGEPGMPAWKERLSSRELSALAVYVMNVVKRTGGEDRWGKQIRRRMAGEQARWRHLAELVEQELNREGRTAEQPSGRVVPPAIR